MGAVAHHRLRQGPERGMTRKTNGPFVLHRLELLESPAWRELTAADLRILHRLEIEHMRHAGKSNSHLPCTYNDFIEYGTRRPSVAPSIRRVEAHGLVVVT